MHSSVLVAAALVCLASGVQAQRKSEFCQGFEEGWKSIVGGALVPICPIEPITPIGSTSFREGLKAGERAAERSGRQRSAIGDNPRRERADAFCDGFEEGYRAIKGELSVVPICPIAPITPIGSTPFREGVKAGMAKARGRGR